MSTDSHVHFEPSIIHTFGTKKPKVTIVCCLHGEEQFGLRVFDYFLKHAPEFGDFKLILAHPTATQLKKRFIDKDMNRVFPGKPDGCIEEQLAHNLMPQIQDCEYLIDVHTTVSDMTVAPIVTHWNATTRRMINATSAKYVAHVHSHLRNTAMIGQVENGISLEYNQKYAKSATALNDLVTFVKRLVNEERQPRQLRKVLHIDGDIAKSIKLPKSVKNFQKIRTLELYPFLYHPKSYTTIHALSASKAHWQKI